MGIKFLIPELVISSLLALGLCLSPWTGQFSFEYSFFLSIGLFFLTSMSLFVRNPIDMGNRKIKWFISYLILLDLPFFIVLLFSLRYGLCSFQTGVTWYFLLPCISVFYSVSCWIFAVSYRQGHLKTTLIALGPTLLFSLITLIELYVDPALSFHHPILYFPGPIYDEWIPRFSSLYTYRFWILLLAVGLSVRGSIPQKNWRYGMLLLIVPFLFRGPLGWHTSHNTLQKKLGNKEETTYTQIFFPDSKRSEIMKSKALLDVHIQNISQYLEVDLDPNKKITLYIYPDVIEKKKWVGTAYTLVGNPMQNSLHLLNLDPKDSILIHELTHVIAAPLGMPFLKLSPRMGFTEGLATALEEDYRKVSVHAWPYVMEKMNVLPNIESMFGIFSFFKESPIRAYQMSGSFSRWLIDTYGVEKFKKAYQGEPIEKTYNFTIQKLTNKWKLFLNNISVDPEVEKKLRLRLEQKPFYKKQCVHEVAELLMQYRYCESQNCEASLQKACLLAPKNKPLQNKCAKNN